MAKLVGLSAKRCVPCEEGEAQALPEPDANRLRNQVRCCLHVDNKTGLPAVPCVHLRKVQTPNALQPRTCPHTSVGTGVLACSGNLLGISKVCCCRLTASCFATVRRCQAGGW